MSVYLFYAAFSSLVCFQLSCTETDMDMGRETDTTNSEKCGIRYSKETTTDIYIYIYIYQKGHETYILQTTIHQLDLKVVVSFITIKINKLKYCLKQYSSISSAIDKSPAGKHLNRNMSTTSKHRFQTVKLLDGCIQMLPSNKYYVVYTSRKVLKFVIKHNFLLCKTDSTILYLGWSTH